MKKEITYLSLPDYFNKFLFSNLNQKIDIKDNLTMQFRLSNNYHLGSSLKAIYLLEILFPRKVSVIKMTLKKKKLYFGQKANNLVFFNFNITLSSLEFIEFFRFFSSYPFNLKKITELFLINKKLKQFEFNRGIFVVKDSTKFSFFVISLYHLN